MKYGLIGGNLGHSYSPFIHSLLGSSPYQLKSLRPQELTYSLNQSDTRGLFVKMKYRIAGESGYRGYRKWQDGILEDVKRLEKEYSMKTKEKEHGTTQIPQ